MQKKHLLSLSLDQLKDTLLDICQKPYKVKQILQWIFIHHVIDFSKMTNISKELMEKLSTEFDTSLPEIANQLKSEDGTTKFKLKLKDDKYIEMVFMPDIDKNTVCLSTQVGCSRNCAFCATAKMGLIRNLTQTELLAQLYVIYNRFPDKKITNLVLMGMGEPLDNFENVIDFLNILTADAGLCFSGRRLTLSTCGITSKIYELAEQSIKLKLAISLNSAIDSKRDQIMPINKLYPLAELKKAVIDFRKKTNYRITFEYIMIENFNMGDEDIKALIKFCGDISCKINLIKWNPVKNLDWTPPSDKKVEEFVSKLKAIPVAVTQRKSRGGDIAGACGQLAAMS